MTVRLRALDSSPPGDDLDLLAVGALHQRSRATAYAQILSAGTLTRRPAEAFGEWWRERWRWERETHRLTVAERHGELVGFTYVGPSRTHGAVELYGIHVDPRLVGTGVGRRLMDNALTQLAEMGGERAVLWVLEANERARRFYARGGWCEDGATRVEPVDDEPVRQLRYSRPL